MYSFKFYFIPVIFILLITCFHNLSFSNNPQESDFYKLCQGDEELQKQYPTMNLFLKVHGKTITKEEINFFVSEGRWECLDKLPQVFASSNLPPNVKELLDKQVVEDAIIFLKEDLFKNDTKKVEQAQNFMTLFLTDDILRDKLTEKTALNVIAITMSIVGRKDEIRRILTDEKFKEHIEPQTLVLLTQHAHKRFHCDLLYLIRDEEKFIELIDDAVIIFENSDDLDLYLAQEARELIVNGSTCCSCFYWVPLGFGIPFGRMCLNIFN